MKLNKMEISKEELVRQMEDQGFAVSIVEKKRVFGTTHSAKMHIRHDPRHRDRVYLYVGDGGNERAQTYANYFYASDIDQLIAELEVIKTELA